MNVTRVVSLAELDQLVGDWRAAYQEDSSAHFFLSWEWLRPLLEIERRPWCVLAVRHHPSEPYVAFLPLIARGALIRGLRRYGGWRVGGKPLSDYAGFLCRPGHEADAFPALALYLQETWPADIIYLEDTLDPRLDLFLSCFGSGRFEARHASPRPAPCIDLPSTWDEYLQQRLSPKARYHLRRCLRTVEGTDGFRITTGDAGTLELEAQRFVAMWQEQWGRSLRWGPAMDSGVFLHMVRALADSGRLWFRMSWLHDEPLAGLVAYADRERGTLRCQLTAFNTEHAALAPGKALFGQAIREAIGAGFHRFDLLVGGEDYKTVRLGAEQRLVANVVLVPRGALRRARALLRNVAQDVGIGARRPSASRVEVRGLWPGQWVQVKPLARILETLDADGALEGCAFTDQMARSCGRTARVSKRVERFFDEQTRTSRRCRRVVVLDLPACDGSGHPGQRGCDRACMLFWKTAWLERIEGRDASAAPAAAAPPHRPETARLGEDCQLMRRGAGGDEPWTWRMERLVGGAVRPFDAAARRRLRRLGSVVEGLPQTARRRVHNAMHALSPEPPRHVDEGRASAEDLSAEEVRAVATELWTRLRPGDRVRVRTVGEIARTLDEHGRCRGCYFMSSMRRYCGREMRVLRRVEVFYDEVRGKLVRSRNIVALEGAHCDGGGSSLTGGCDRTCHAFWRTEWLRPVETTT